MIESAEYEERRARHEFLRNRQLELEILIRKNASDLQAVAPLRKEYREVNQELSNILNANILESDANNI